MKFAKLLAAFGMAFALSGNAGAAIFTGATGSSSNTVTDYSTPSLLSFDLDWRSPAPVTFNFQVEAADLSSPYVGFNALIRNLSGIGFEAFSINLSNVSFLNAGTITPTFGALGTQGSSASAAWATFSRAEPAELYFGNPLGASGQRDWVLNLSGLNEGDTFAVTAAVPEPATYASMLAGLVMLGGLARRRRKQG